MGPREGDGAGCGTAGLTAAAMRALATNPWLPLASGTVAPDFRYALWYATLRRLTSIRASIDHKLPR